MVKLEGYRISSLKFKNELDRDEDLKVNIEFEYNVVYFESDDKYIGTCNVNFFEEDNETFSFGIEVQGKFSISEEQSKESIHRKSFSLLYPLTQEVVRKVTENIVFVPIKLPDINPESITIQEDMSE